MMISKKQLKENISRVSKILGKKMPKAFFERFECIEYIHKLNDEEAKYVVELYNEYYNDGISFKSPEKLILKTDEQKKEGRKNHNSMKRDAFPVAKKRKMLYSMNGEVPTYESYIHNQKDDWEWQKTYKLAGYEVAMRTIFDQIIEELKTSPNKYMTLSKFLSRVKELNKYNRRDIKTQKELKRAKENLK